MYVGSVNNYSNQNSFKSLKIDANLASKLEAKSPDFIKRLATIGTDIEGVKKFHVVLKDDCTPKVYAEDVLTYGERDYFQELKQEIEPNLGKVYDKKVGNNLISDVYPNTPWVFGDIYSKNTQVEKYNEFRKLDIFGRAAEYSKMLSKWAEKSEKEKLEKINAQKMAELKEKQKIEEHRKSVFDLIDKYKLENSSTKDVEEVKQPKKKWWKFF